jgi:hypothetical protein
VKNRALAPIACVTLLSTLLGISDAGASVVIDGKTIEVVDAHVHSGHFGHTPASARAFSVKLTPAPLKLYLPGISEQRLDPWGAHIGIKDQSAIANVDHVLLFSVYTQQTAGYFTNSELEDALLDPRNTSSDPTKPWAWGMASINFFDGYTDPGVAEERLAALSSYFTKHPGLFVGIKLAHAHQAVAFDDPAYLGVYDIAAQHGVPVLLHTGFSPFPGTKSDSPFYDPAYLESIVTNYDGAHGNGRVEFVLSHVGQGDARAIESALSLAQAHDNVHLELSALNRPLVLDAAGMPVMQSEPQYPYVLSEIKSRGLVARAIYGSDGPQGAGHLQKYLGIMIAGMQAAGFSTDEIAQVLAGNFKKVFLKVP